MDSMQSQITNGIFHRTREKKCLNVCGNTKDTEIAKEAFLKKNYRPRGIRVSDFSLYYKATVTKEYGSSTKTDT